MVTGTSSLVVELQVRRRPVGVLPEPGRELLLRGVDETFNDRYWSASREPQRSMTSRGCVAVQGLKQPFEEEVDLTVPK